SFARIVISNRALTEIYSLRAALLGFRSAWNVAIAEYMSDNPLGVKPPKIRFEKTLITGQLRKHIRVNLFKRIPHTGKVQVQEVKAKSRRITAAVGIKKKTENHLLQPVEHTVSSRLRIKQHQKTIAHHLFGDIGSSDPT